MSSTAFFPTEAAWRWWALALVTVAATAVIAPMFFWGSASGHDFEFHVSSWMEVAQQWEQGIVFPRWAALANFGFGEPRFVFYPPASWLLGAALGRILPWEVVPPLMIWLTLIMAGMSMFRLAREWLPGEPAVAGAVLYAVNPYHLVVVYYRSDFAELLVSAIFPLLVLQAILVADRRWRAAAPLAITLAFIWLANAPAAVIATYAFVLLLVVVCAQTKSMEALLSGSAALAAGFGLAAFYVLPAAWEQRWVNINQVLSANLRPEANFLFAQSTDPDFVLFNIKVSAVALGLIGATFIAIVLSRRERLARRQAWWPMALLGMSCMVLMSSSSMFFWRLLPKLRFVQFPWRLLVPLDVVCVFLWLVVSARWQWRWFAWLAGIVCLAGLGTFMVRDAFWDTEDIALNRTAIVSGQGYEGTDEYAPLGCDRSELLRDAPSVAVAEGISPPPMITVQRWTPEKKVFVVASRRAVILALRLVNYPAWNATLNGKPVPIASAPETGQMLLAVPAGTNSIEVTFERTPDRTWGGIISAVSAVVLVLFSLLHRKQRTDSSRHPEQPTAAAAAACLDSCGAHSASLITSNSFPQSGNSYPRSDLR